MRREGVGRCMWVDKEKRKEERRENLRRQQHRVCVCMNSKDLVNRHLWDRGRCSLSILSWMTSAPMDARGRGGGLGVPRPLPGREGAGDAAQETPHLSQGDSVPAPLQRPLKPWDAQGP